ncbi:hypothetical protein EDB85DRAFT_1891048 [Lactarius pseudohatsudake]|nr:hypothetical protein EDB85DRAFT_1891048 [Lactarius pseudohatsudake]
MATRAFVVFRDEPSKPLSTAVKTDVSLSPSSLLIQPTILVLSPGTPLTTAEKENLHPSTGTRSGVIADPQSKKRKNSVLATKLHIPPTIKKQRDSALDGRKRKTASTSSSKGSKVTTSGASELPKVEEVVEPEPCSQSKVTQAEVDSRCYDLTVSPLADVSHAFDQVSLSPVEPRLDNPRVLAPKQKASLSEESEIPLPKPVARATAPKKVDIAGEEASFSTPERKQIYAAFTFTSPSPSSKRFATPHLDIFGDIRFDP